MTAAVPEQPSPERVVPTPEQIEEYCSRRFPNIEALLEAWFALFGHEVKAGPFVLIDRGDATG